MSCVRCQPCAECFRVLLCKACSCLCMLLVNSIPGAISLQREMLHLPHSLGVLFGPHGWVSPFLWAVSRQNISRTMWWNAIRVRRPGNPKNEVRAHNPHQGMLLVTPRLFIRFHLFEVSPSARNTTLETKALISTGVFVEFSATKLGKKPRIPGHGASPRLTSCLLWNTKETFLGHSVLMFPALASTCVFILLFYDWKYAVCVHTCMHTCSHCEVNRNHFDIDPQLDDIRDIYIIV